MQQTPKNDSIGVGWLLFWVAFAAGVAAAAAFWLKWG
jgi:zinc transporter ZupT